MSWPRYARNERRQAATKRLPLYFHIDDIQSRKVDYAEGDGNDVSASRVCARNAAAGTSCRIKGRPCRDDIFDAMPSARTEMQFY